ncbi:hypothetical protein [Stutzerimonas chloritidismutans]
MKGWRARTEADSSCCGSWVGIRCHNTGCT